MSAREDVANALTAALPGARIIPHARSIDNIPNGQPVVMVYRQTVAPSPVQGARAEELALWCVVPGTDPAAEDALDALLDEVLAVLDGRPFPSLAWTDAARDTLLDQWPAYKITCTILTGKG